KILLAVSSLDKFSRHRVEGYGHFSFPRQPGAHDMTIQTWRPESSLRAKLQDYFVGGGHRLHDPCYTSKPSDFKGNFLSRFGFRTESSGTVRIRLYIVEQVRSSSPSNNRLASTLASGVGGHRLDLGGTRTIKEILRAVHARKTSAEVARRFSATI
ncbi:unnamed protein product, partial [Choristocarpus tenellus]